MAPAPPCPYGNLALVLVVVVLLVVLLVLVVVLFWVSRGGVAR
jgi:hypothetical protein